MGAIAVALYVPVTSSAVDAGGDLTLPWVLLAAGFALAEVYSLHVGFRGEAWTFSVSEILLVLGLFAVSPSHLIAAELIGPLVVLVAVERQAPMKVCYNVAHFVLHAEVALLVFHAIAVPEGPLAVRNWIAALTAVLAGSIVQLFAISLAVTIVEGRLRAREMCRSFIWGTLCSLVNTMLGLVVVIVCSESLAAGALLLAPIAVVFVAYRAYLSENTKSEGLRFLYQASETLSGQNDLEDGLLALLVFARDTFHAELAEIVLVGESDEAVGYRTCSGPGERGFRLEPCDRGIVDAVLEVADGDDDVVQFQPPRGSLLARHEDTDIACMMVSTLYDETGMASGAVFVARHKDATVQRFEKDEVRLFETFVNHLAITLEKSRLSTSLAQLRLLKQELAHQAHHDSLTGLANRLKFRNLADDALRDAGQNGKKVAVLFIDLDDFKTVNDSMGHAAGDALLGEVASRIEASVGASGTAARLGGDEFAVLLPAIDSSSEARAIADRIMLSLGQPVQVDGQSVIAQASIGIATHADAADAAELMQNADVAMYTAKRNGKGRFDEFEPDMSLTVLRRHDLKVGLERALNQDEFVLHYQPVIGAESGTMVAAEALLRWADPVRGLMPPNDFVGLAEETGLIIPIGRKVLFEACRQAAEWVTTAPDFTIFINLSMRQLGDADIVDDVASALAMSGLDARHVVLEVTETAMMRDIDEGKATLFALKELGVRLALDDFGTGFSSLSYLRELPIDVLKIAKPIVDAICESSQDALFVKGIIELGHVVGMAVVAEGVEKIKQYAQLIDMHCDYVQGHYYAPSLEPARIDEILRANPVIAKEQRAAVRLAG
jgi:diguanylate cyclase (GGDEF)-like protein